MYGDDEVQTPEAALLEELNDNGRLNYKQLAAASRRHQATIYRYMSGDLTIPVAVLNAAFRLTGDLRIVLLITGGVPVQIQALDTAGNCPCSETERKPPIRIPPPEQALDELHDVLEDGAKAAKYLRAIFADGRLTPGDLLALDKFDECMGKMRIKQAVCQTAMQTARERIMK